MVILSIYFIAGFDSCSRVFAFILPIHQFSSSYEDCACDWSGCRAGAYAHVLGAAVNAFTYTFFISCKWHFETRVSTNK